jgi:hypothetical protein
LTLLLPSSPALFAKTQLKTLSFALSSDGLLIRQHSTLLGFCCDHPLLLATLAPVPFRLSPLPRAQLFAYLNMAVNASFVSPTADAKVAHMIQQFDTSGLLSTIFTGFNIWKLALTLIITAVAYDQCTTYRLNLCARHG